MAMKNETYIEKLIEDFFEGKTSIAEEKKLFEYFSGDNVSENLMKYQTLFNYFEKDIAEELEQIEDQPIEEEDRVDKRILNKKRLFAFITIAASLSLVLWLSPFGDLIKVNPYKGSYAMVNGEKVYLTDANALEQMEKEVMDEIAKQEEGVADIFQEVNAKQKRLACLENESFRQEASYEEMEKEINNKIKRYEKLIQNAN